MSRKYPIGLQSFREIRERGYIYVDKTEVIHRLVDTGKYYFLSRPRRFGKSLLVDTLEELFKGNQDLFKGLWIEDQWDWSRSNPVIHLRMSRLPYQKIGLYQALSQELNRIGMIFGVELFEQDLKSKFSELMEQVSATHGQVVVLIDEYDKPIVDYLHDEHKLEENRLVFKQFYSVLKDADQYIRFLLLTGVSRFSKISLFSDLNNLRDITMSNVFSDIAGITQAELERNFIPEIQILRMDRPRILEEIREWYNGYSWDVKTRVYNPFSLLNFMAEPTFKNYWFTTGTPTFLLEQLKLRKLSDMDGERVSANQLSEFDTDRLDMASLLFQTGYLTIKKELVPSQLFELGYPNREVRESFLEGLLNIYREPVIPNSAALTYDLRLAMDAYDVPAMMNALNALIGTIPYDHWRADREGLFTIITVLAFKLAGAEVYSEVHSAGGRCDVLVKTPHHIYVIEVKLDGTAQQALDQIHRQRYFQPYLDDRRMKIALGISFSSDTRRVAEYLEEVITG